MKKRTSKRSSKKPARVNPAPGVTQGVNLTPHVHAGIRSIAETYDIGMGRTVLALLRGWGLLSLSDQQRAILGSPGTVQIPVEVPADSPLSITPAGEAAMDAADIQASSDQSAPNTTPATVGI